MTAFTDKSILNTIGAETIGIAFALFLGGIVLQQAFRYFAMYPKDRWQFKFLIALLVTFDVCHSVTLTATLYNWDVDQWGSSVAPNSSPKIFSVSVLFSAMITSIVQLFYSYRIYAMTRSYLIPGLVVAGSTVQFSTCLTQAVYLLVFSDQSKLTRITAVTVTTMISSALIDVVITLTIFHRLRRTKRRKNKNADCDIDIERIIRKIAFLSIQTNAVTMIVAVTTVVIFLGNESGWDNATYFSCVKLYIISLLAVLNSRPTTSDFETTNAIWLRKTSILLPSDEANTIIGTEFTDIHFSESGTPFPHYAYVSIEDCPPAAVIHLQ